MRLLQAKHLPTLLGCLCLLLISNNTLADSTRNFPEINATPSLLQALTKGTYVLYLRHGATDSAYPDQVPIDLHDCNTQRPLSDAGRSEIAQVGEYIRQAAIPVGDIYVSPLCRAQESAQLALLRSFTTEVDLMYTAHLTTQEKIPVVAKTRELISRPVEAGSNRMIIAHAPNLADLMGYFPTIEGSLIIFRPLGHGEFEYLATIRPAHWPALLDEIDKTE